MHFTFVSMPAYGHVNPTLPLVSELVRRGHRVTYGTHEKFKAAVETAGAEFISVPGDVPPPPTRIDFSPESIAKRTEDFNEIIAMGLPPMIEQLERDRPDALCYDAMSHNGRILAKRENLPDIALHPTYASNEHFSLRNEVMPANLAPYQEVMERAAQSMSELATEFGVHEKIDPMLLTGGWLNIAFIPRSFQPFGETFGDRYRFVGPSTGPRPEDASWQPPSDQQPLLFISLGTAFNNRADFFRTCLEAFGDSDWQVAMAIGNQVGVDDLGRIPENFEIRPYFPQPSVLRHSRVFVSHMGMNSTMEALHTGVPLVGVPQMGEQELNAQQVATLGLGRKLADSEITADLLRSAVDEIDADEQVRANVAAMRDKLQAAGGVVAAADAIEEELRPS